LDLAFGTLFVGVVYLNICNIEKRKNQPNYMYTDKIYQHPVTWKCLRILTPVKILNIYCLTLKDKKIRYTLYGMVWFWKM
jgi:hypothetical protein